MKTGTIALAALLVMGLVSIAHATLSGDHRDLHARIVELLHGDLGARMAEHLDDVSDQLELDAQQRRQVAATILAATPGLEERGRALVDAHREQLGLVRSGELDEAAIRAAAIRLGQAQGEFAIEVARALKDVHAALTPDQLARAAKLHGHGSHLLEVLHAHAHGAGAGMRMWAERQ